MCYSPKKYGLFTYPCGTCLECRSKVRINWSIRLAIELYYSILNGEIGVFSTLTYNDENVPKSSAGFNSLCKRDVQLFFKRLRKLVDVRKFSTNGIRFFLCGEYGPSTLRPHYHLLLFGFDNCVSCEEIYKIISKSWSLGFVQQIEDSVCIEQVQYCSQYMCKEEVLPDSSCILPFRMMSNNLGASYLSPVNISWHYSGFDVEELDDVFSQNEFFHSFYGDFDKRRNRHDGFQSFESYISHILQYEYNNESFDELSCYVFGQEISTYIPFLRDYLPNNLLPFCNGKNIPRYLRDKIFSLPTRFCLNCYHTLSSFYEQERKRRSMNLDVIEFEHLKDDLKKIKEKKHIDYYHKVSINNKV